MVIRPMGAMGAGCCHRPMGSSARVSREIAGPEASVSREIASLGVRLTREIAAGKVDRVKWAIGALTAQTALLPGVAKLF
ncbi:MAG: hypothetical protein KGQ67_07180 [Betaproteobacteria bacterium]|nr:hypothetical protein [Betaproteobacteria bacterium]